METNIDCVSQKEKNNLPKISVIVPIYNIENYLRASLDSLVEQTFENIEILLVDDGSTDSSGMICDEYAKKDIRIQVIHQQNQGAAAARNHALDQCSGELLTFWDGDDVATKDYLLKLYQALVETNGDISICGWQEIEESWQGELVANQKGVIESYTALEALTKLMYQEQFDSAMWCKLYRRELFLNVRFPVGNLFEDIAIIYKVFEKAKKVCYFEYLGYGYRLRESGTTLTQFKAKKMDLIDVIDEMETYLLGKYKELTKAVYSRATRANFHIYLQIPVDKSFEKMQKRIEKNICRYRKIVIKDKRARRGTKIAILISFISFSLLQKMRIFKEHGKQ